MDTSHDVIIIGNGPSAAQGDLGEVIDRCDEIVRFNNFDIAGREAQLGSRTDTWCITSHWDIKRGRLNTLDIRKLLLITYEPKSKAWVEVHDWARGVCSERGIVFEVVSADTQQRARAAVGGLRASSGLTAIVHYLEQQPTVTTLGFDFFDSKAGHHYFDDQPRPAGCPHSGSRERDWFEQQIIAGTVRPMHLENVTHGDGFIVVSGYTRSTPYEEAAGQLAATLRKFNLPHRLYPYTSTGDWTRNTMRKARIVQLAMREFPGKDIVWIDADAIVCSRPEFFFSLPQQDFDVCCHHLRTHYNPNELLTGTIIFRQTPAAIKLADDWAGNTTVDWDQRILQRLMAQQPLKVLPLPAEYIRIRAVGQPVDVTHGVVFHKQMSRDKRANVPAAAPGPEPTAVEVFGEIFKKRKWSGASASGPGSTLTHVKYLMEELPAVLADLGIKSMLDVPCGDLYWISTMDFAGMGVRYTGGDIVSDLVVKNRDTHPELECVVMDACVDPLPECDLIFTRDMLVHLPFSQISAYLDNVRKSRIKYMALTSFTGRRRNVDCALGAWRPLNMQVAPFNLPPPIRVIVERCEQDSCKFADKSIAIWKVADIVGSIPQAKPPAMTKDYSYPPNAIVPLVMAIVKPKSVTDWGCNCAVWLRAFKDAGVTDVHGYDTLPWQSDSLISAEEFTQTNFEHDIRIRKCDLAINLENAEHVSAGRADALIDALTQSAPVVLFSAAIPGQGGDGHINEQHHSYWHYKFAKRGYMICDVLRWAVADDPRVPKWYRDNMFLYTSIPLPTVPRT